MGLDAKSVETILQCTDYRSFLLQYKKQKSSTRRFTYTMIARRGGFKAKSFPRDVFVGNKNLSATSLYPMIKGLGLCGDLAEYFKTLVQIEHPEITTPVKSVSQLHLKLNNLRSRILKKRKITTENDPYKIELFPIIYAACGNSKEGASIEEVVRRTAISYDEIKNTLSSLKDIGLVYQNDENRYFGVDNHLFFESIEASYAFQKHFSYLSNKSVELAAKNFKTDQALFFSSNFSIQQDKMPELKSALRSLLLQYVDSSENPDGDKVVSLVCSLF